MVRRRIGDFPGRRLIGLVRLGAGPGAGRRRLPVSKIITLTGPATLALPGALALFVQQYGQQRHAPLSGPAPTTQTARSLKKP
jgi:hypothetical protein